MIQPNDKQLEEAVLGAMILETTALHIALPLLEEADFYQQKNKEVFNSIITLDNAHRDIDLLTVTQQAKALEYSADAFYITQLTSRVNQTGNLETWCLLLRQLSMKRKILLVSADLKRTSQDLNSDVFEDIDKYQQALSDISDVKTASKGSDLKNVMLDALEHTSKVISGEIEACFKTGLRALDAIQRWQRQEMHIIAARPGMGKTLMMLQLSLNLARFGYKVAIFSLEMGKRELGKRLSANVSQIDSLKITDGNMTDTEFMKYQNLVSQVLDLPITINDTPAISPNYLRSRCREIKNKKGLDIIFIDYLQLMKMSGEKIKNRENEISNISQSIKAISKEFDALVIPLCQLSRAVETRGGDKKPMLSDLRESGSLEQDADGVWFCYRPEYYGITEDEEGNSTKGLMQLIAAKQRNGKLGTAEMKVSLPTQSISNYDAVIDVIPSQPHTSESYALPIQNDISSNLM